MDGSALRISSCQPNEELQFAGSEKRSCVFCIRICRFGSVATHQVESMKESLQGLSDLLQKEIRGVSVLGIIACINLAYMKTKRFHFAVLLL